MATAPWWAPAEEGDVPSARTARRGNLCRMELREPQLEAPAGVGAMVATGAGILASTLALTAVVAVAGHDGTGRARSVAAPPAPTRTSMVAARPESFSAPGPAASADALAADDRRGADGPPAAHRTALPVRPSPPAASRVQGPTDLPAAPTSPRATTGGGGRVVAVGPRPVRQGADGARTPDRRSTSVPAPGRPSTPVPHRADPSRPDASAHRTSPPGPAHRGSGAAASRPQPEPPASPAPPEPDSRTALRPGPPTGAGRVDGRAVPPAARPAPTRAATTVQGRRAPARAGATPLPEPLPTYLHPRSHERPGAHDHR